METLCAWLSVGCVVWLFYRQGKQLGSRKGYHFGRRHRRH